MLIRNLFKDIRLPEGDTEIFEGVCTAGNLSIERIISNGQTTPAGKWYNSDRNEWVVLLKGKASLEMENGMVIHLSEGDYLLIPAGQKHRVSYTSKEPPCIWLAVHFD